MAKGRPRYYRPIKGKAFWCPSQKMIAAGFAPRPLGPDGPDAFREAETWNRKWDAHCRGEEINMTAAAPGNLSSEHAEELTIYPPGSIGHGFKEYRKLDAWRVDKGARTREEWFRAWKHIKPVFGDVNPNSIQPAQMEAFRNIVRDRISVREAHRVIKIWRALWNVLKVLTWQGRPYVTAADPSKVFKNTAASARSATWTEGEVARLVKQAWRAGYHGLAAIIAVAWDTQLNPGDIRPLSSAQMAKTMTGDLFFTERGKTGVPVGGILSRRTVRLLVAYLETIGVEMMGDAPIFRNRSGRPYSKDTLGDDFRDIRGMVFGDGERRTLGHDFRRSGAVEAFAGDASAANVARTMGNTLSASNALFATYVPVNVQAIRAVAEARKVGRRKL